MSEARSSSSPPVGSSSTPPLASSSIPPGGSRFTSGGRFAGGRLPPSDTQPLLLDSPTSFATFGEDPPSNTSTSQPLSSGRNSLTRLPQSSLGRAGAGIARALMGSRGSPLPRRTSFLADDEPGNPQMLPLGRKASTLLRLDTTQMNEEEGATQCYEIHPVTSVYSYFLFMPPVEQRRKKRYCTWLTFFTLWLIFVNFVMQFGLLYVVGGYIMLEHTEWVGKIIHLEHSRIATTNPLTIRLFSSGLHNPFFSGQEAKKMHCVDDYALCQQADNMVTCAPPAIKLLQNWQLLDIDGDGIWQRSEAENYATRKHIQCKFSVDPLDFYETTVENLQKLHRIDDLRDANLREGLGIHQAYMNLTMGDSIMCLYGDEEMCGNLFSRGIFDRGIGVSSASGLRSPRDALKYCQKLLRDRCPLILGDSLRLRRVETQARCGSRRYSPVVYSHKPSDSQLVLSKVSFTKQSAYDHTQHLGFRTYVAILLVVFLTTMAFELKSIGKVFMWAWVVPVFQTKSDGELSKKAVIISRSSLGTENPAANIEPQPSDESDEEWVGKRKTLCVSPKMNMRTEIRAVRSDHRTAVIIVTALRTFLFLTLTFSGVVFLTSDTRYLGLIFDALSLVFIIQIDELLYETMIRSRMREDHCEIEPMAIKGASFDGYLSAVQMDLLCSLGIILCAVCITLEYCWLELNPIKDSLDCACSTEGAGCIEAAKYSREWWDTYWSAMLPNALHAVTSLMAQEAPAI